MTLKKSRLQLNSVHVQTLKQISKNIHAVYSNPGKHNSITYKTVNKQGLIKGETLQVIYSNTMRRQPEAGHWIAT